MTLWEITDRTRIGEKLTRVRQQMSENQGEPWTPSKDAAVTPIKK
jgi:hypothetical protein